MAEQDEYEDEYEDEDYEDELEYIEIKGSSEETSNRKKLYMENDYSVQTNNQNNVKQIDEEKNINFKQMKNSKTSYASKRPIQNAAETLDIEPLNENNLVQENQKLENFEIDDPW